MVFAVNYVIQRFQVGIFGRYRDSFYLLTGFERGVQFPDSFANVNSGQGKAAGEYFFTQCFHAVGNDHFLNFFTAHKTTFVDAFKAFREQQAFQIITMGKCHLSDFRKGIRQCQGSNFICGKKCIGVNQFGSLCKGDGRNRIQCGIGKRPPEGTVFSFFIKDLILYLEMSIAGIHLNIVQVCGGKSPGSNGGYILRDGNTVQLCHAESVCVYGSQAVRQGNGCQFLATGKSALSDRSQPFRQGDSCKGFQTVKSILSNGFQSCAAGDSLQGNVLIESQSTNGGNAVRQFNGCQAAEVCQSIAADTGDTLADGNGGNYFPVAVPGACGTAEQALVHLSGSFQNQCVAGWGSGCVPIRI